MWEVMSNAAAITDDIKFLMTSHQVVGRFCFRIAEVYRYLNFIRIHFSNWIIGRLANAYRYTHPSCIRFRVSTLNTRWSPGTVSTVVISTAPSTNAPSSHLLWKNRFVKITGRSDLQLNPWNKRARQSVPKANVLPRSAPWLCTGMNSSREWF